MKKRIIKKANKKVCIDGDILVYRAGFAANGEPLENNLHLVKLIIESILKETKAADFEIYLSGPSIESYRNKLAVTAPYKGNRDPAHRPVFFQEIRDYLIDTWGGVIVHGAEADDMLGIQLTKDPEDTIIASIDKDLLQVPGQHYHFVKKEHIYIDELQGDTNFLKQLIVGDRTDNIIGVPKYGEKKAERLMLGIESYSEGWDLVTDLYRSKIKDAHPLERLNENANLLWVSRENFNDFSTIHNRRYLFSIEEPEDNGTVGIVSEES